MGPTVDPEYLWFEATNNVKHPRIQKNQNGIFVCQNETFLHPLLRVGAVRGKQSLHHMLVDWAEGYMEQFLMCDLRLLRAVSYHGNHESRIGKGIARIQYSDTVFELSFNLGILHASCFKQNMVFDFVIVNTGEDELGLPTEAIAQILAFVEVSCKEDNYLQIVAIVRYLKQAEPEVSLLVIAYFIL